MTNKPRNTLAIEKQKKGGAVTALTKRAKPYRLKTKKPNPTSKDKHKKKVK